MGVCAFSIIAAEKKDSDGLPPLKMILKNSNGGDITHASRAQNDVLIGWNDCSYGW